MFSVVRVLVLGGLVGKMLGVLRELLSAWLFGTGLVANSYRLSQSAFLIPLHGFVSDAVNGGFSPRFSVLKSTDPIKARALFAWLHLILLVLSIVVAAFLVVFSTQWARFLAPGFGPSAIALSSDFIRVLAISLPSYAVVSLYSAVDLAAGSGAISAARASIQSLGLIIGTLLAWVMGQPLFIAGGFVAAYFLLSFWGARVAVGHGMSFSVFDCFNNARSELINVWRSFRTLIWIPVLLQVHQTIERQVASIVHPDAISALDYARFVSDTLVVLVAVPFATAGLSTMARMSEEEFIAGASRSFRVLLLIGVPVSAIFFQGSEFIVRLLFQRGAFGEGSVLITSDLMAALSLGVWGQLIGYAGGRFLSARARNAEVLVITAIGVFANIAVNLSLEREFGVATMGVAAAVNGILFGGLALWRVGLDKSCFRFLLQVIFFAALYCLLVQLLFSFSDGVFSFFGITALFWLFVLFSSRRMKDVFLDLLAILRRGQ